MVLAAIFLIAKPDKRLTPRNSRATDLDAGIGNNAKIPFQNGNNFSQNETYEKNLRGG
jgi:hypothetical protein